MSLTIDELGNDIIALNKQKKTKQNEIKINNEKKEEYEKELVESKKSLGRYSMRLLSLAVVDECLFNLKNDPSNETHRNELLRLFTEIEDSTYFNNDSKEKNDYAQYKNDLIALFKEDQQPATIKEKIETIKATTITYKRNARDKINALEQGVEAPKSIEKNIKHLSEDFKKLTKQTINIDKELKKKTKTLHKMQKEHLKVELEQLPEQLKHEMIALEGVIHSSEHKAYSYLFLKEKPTEIKEGIIYIYLDEDDKEIILDLDKTSIEKQGKLLKKMRGNYICKVNNQIIEEKISFENNGLAKELNSSAKLFSLLEHDKKPNDKGIFEWEVEKSLNRTGDEIKADLISHRFEENKLYPTRKRLSASKEIDKSQMDIFFYYPTKGQSLAVTITNDPKNEGENTVYIEEKTFETYFKKFNKNPLTQEETEVIQRVNKEVADYVNKKYPLSIDSLGSGIKRIVSNQVTLKVHEEVATLSQKPSDIKNNKPQIQQMQGRINWPVPSTEDKHHIEVVDKIPANHTREFAALMAKFDFPGFIISKKTNDAIYISHQFIKPPTIAGFDVVTTRDKIDLLPWTFRKVRFESEQDRDQYIKMKEEDLSKNFAEINRSLGFSEKSKEALSPELLEMGKEILSIINTLESKLKNEIKKIGGVDSAVFLTQLAQLTTNVMTTNDKASFDKWILMLRELTTTLGPRASNFLSTIYTSAASAAETEIKAELKKEKADVGGNKTLLYDVTDELAESAVVDPLEAMATTQTLRSTLAARTEAIYWQANIGEFESDTFKKTKEAHDSVLTSIEAMSELRNSSEPQSSFNKVIDSLIDLSKELIENITLNCDQDFKKKMKEYLENPSEEKRKEILDSYDHYTQIFNELNSIFSNLNEVFLKKDQEPENIVKAFKAGINALDDKMRTMNAESYELISTNTEIDKEDMGKNKFYLYPSKEKEQDIIKYCLNGKEGTIQAQDFREELSDVLKGDMLFTAVWNRLNDNKKKGSFPLEQKSILLNILNKKNKSVFLPIANNKKNLFLVVGLTVLCLLQPHFSIPTLLISGGKLALPKLKNYFNQKSGKSQKDAKLLGQQNKLLQDTNQLTKDEIQKKIIDNQKKFKEEVKEVKQIENIDSDASKKFNA